MSDKRLDGYFNAMFGRGTKRFDPMEYYRISPEMELDDESCDQLFTFNGLARKIIEAPACEAVRAQFKLKRGDDVLEKETSSLLSVLEDLKWQEKFSTVLSWDRCFGGGGIYIVADDGAEITEPLNEKNIREIEELRVYDKRDIQISQTYQNPNDRKYSQPMIYAVQNENGGIFYCHESRLLIFNGGIVSNSIRRTRNGWGGKVFDHLKNAIMQNSESFNLALLALSRLSQSVLKFAGLLDLLQNDEGEEAVKKRLNLIDLTRHLMNTIAIDTDDEYDQKNVSLGGVKDILQEMEVWISGQSDIPCAILFGRSPAGMDATGESDFENYYNMVQRIQTSKVKPNLSRLVELISLTKSFNLKLPEEYTIEFNPLWNPSEKETAETDNLKAQSEEKEANTLKIYSDMQALDPSEVRQILAGKYQIDSSKRPWEGVGNE